jgi:NTP pyrophosphatase (non-canonical NTP hydrolase)
MYKINDYVTMAYKNSFEKGWYEDKRSILERIALMHTEVSEATEEVRDGKEDLYEVNGKFEGQSVELADVLIRIFDLSGYSNINIVKYIEQQFFVSYQDLNYIHDIEQEVKQLTNLRCYDEIEQLSTDLEFHASIGISLSEAAKSSMKKNEDRIFYFLSEAVVKIIYFSRKKSWNIEEIMYNKHIYNTTRPYRHGGKRC